MNHPRSSAPVPAGRPASAAPVALAQALEQRHEFKAKVEACAEDLALGIDELKLVEVALASSKAALAETTASLASALAGEAPANRRALHDHTTSLPNRALFEDRLAQALAFAERHG